MQKKVADVQIQKKEVLSMEKLQEQRAIQLYSERKKTILQISQELGIPYGAVRKFLVSQGFSHGCKR